MYEIEDNVPVAPNGSGLHKVKYPFAQLQVGQSFLVPVESNGLKVARNRISATFARHNRSGKKFCLRTVEGGIRVWRIE